MITAPALLRGVDLAAFAVALVARLRAAGVVVSADGPTTFVAAMGSLVPVSRTQLYWAARLSLLNRAEDLGAFDSVFESVFTDAVLPVDPVALKSQRGASAGPVPASAGRPPGGPQADGLPWATRPPTVRSAAETDEAPAIPDLLPSRIVARSDDAFESFDEADLRLIGASLERSLTRWPTRRSMRAQLDRHGKRVDLRATMRSSRRTGFEAAVLERTDLRRRRRRMVLLCDVSGSMQPYAAVYFHLMRAIALRGKGIRPEVFAFSTTLTRLTPTLAHRSPQIAVARANAKVSDRYGGTYLGRSVAELLKPPHGSALRGAVVIIASDGWDSDPPEVLDHALARLGRRAARLVWLNPRAAAPDFQPLAASMAAALPYCDAFLPAHSIHGLSDLFDVLAVL